MIETAMTLHHHHCGAARECHCLSQILQCPFLQTPFWCGKLRTTGLVSTTSIIVLLSFRCIIDIGSEDGYTPVQVDSVYRSIV
jgi:hypothetical protein